MRREAAILAVWLALGVEAPGQLRRKPPLNPIERLRRMPPAQRKKALESLPADRRKQAEQRLDRLNALPPREREDLDRRYEAFQKLPPKDQERARLMFRQFNELPEDRRTALRGEMDTLRGLAPAERADRLKSREFQGRFNAGERSILSDFTSLLEAPQR